MKTKSMMAVSAFALMLGVSACAPDMHTSADSTASYRTSGNGKAVIQNVYFLDKDANLGDELERAVIYHNMTAHGMLGAPVVNAAGKRVATVKDIILNRRGESVLIVVADGGALSIGRKVAAFDYNRVVSQTSDGRVVMALSQDMIDRAADFSYDRKDWTKARVIPKGSISTTELLQGQLLDSSGKKAGTVDNLYFRNGELSQVIVRFDKTLGMGGKLVALNYDDLQLVRKSKRLALRMTVSESAQFRSLEKIVSN